MAGPWTGFNAEPMAPTLGARKGADTLAVLRPAAGTMWPRWNFLATFTSGIRGLEIPGNFEPLGQHPRGPVVSWRDPYLGVDRTLEALFRSAQRALAVYLRLLGRSDPNLLPY